MTSKSRELIFNRLKNKNRSDEDIIKARAMITNYISSQSRGPIPDFSGSADKQFIKKITNAAATVTSVQNYSEVSVAINDYLLSNDIDKKLVVASTKELSQLEWQEDISTEYRIANATDTTSLCHAYAGIAETGSLVLCSSKETPVSLNFLPDNCICVVEKKRIYRNIEDIWDLIRNELNVTPRTINFITGPSRTADVEQTIQLGAHGPRRLHVIVIDS